MSMKRIFLALGAVAMFGMVAAGTVGAAGFDISPDDSPFVQQATPTTTATASPTGTAGGGAGTPSPGSTGNAGLAGDGSTPVVLALGAVALVGAVVGASRWASARRTNL